MIELHVLPSAVAELALDRIRTLAADFPGEERLVVVVDRRRLELGEIWTYEDCEGLRAALGEFGTVKRAQSGIGEKNVPGPRRGLARSQPTGATPLRRGKVRDVRAGESRAERRRFRAKVFRLYGDRCIVTGDRARDAHHVVSKQQLRKDGHARLVWDPENGVPVSRDVHNRHESAFERIPRDKLPARAVAWALRHGYGSYLDRYYA